MMESRTRTEAKHQAGRRQGGLCRGPGSGDRLLRQRGRVAYRTLKRHFQLDDEALEDLKIELIDSQRLATDEQGTVLGWTGEIVAPPVSATTPALAAVPLGYTQDRPLLWPQGLPDEARGDRMRR
jgi:hypothetical protein